MNKLSHAVAAAAAVTFMHGTLSAAVASAEKPPADAAEAVEMDEEETAIFECGFDFDFLTAYIDKNAVCNDEMVMQPCVWADLTYFDPFWIGFSIWQNYDLTDRRHKIYRYGLNETDYNVHVGVTPWTSEDEAYSVDLELGHEWFTYHGTRGFCGEDWLRGGYPDTRELYFKATFDNPVVGVYGEAHWMYGDFGDCRAGMYYALGFTKEVEVTESVSVGADWNVGFGDSRYLSFLYGGVSRPYLAEGEEEGEVELCDDYDEGPQAGFGGTTVKIYATWQLTEWCSLGAVVAYTGVLNGSIRESLGDQGDDNGFCYTDDGYPRDLLWGGLQLRLTY